jgi:hypothetical protein
VIDVGDIVHYTTRDPERAARKLAAIVVEIHPGTDPAQVDLWVVTMDQPFRAWRVEYSPAKAGSESARGKWTPRGR